MQMGWGWGRRWRWIKLHYLNDNFIQIKFDDGEGFIDVDKEKV